MWGSFIKKKQKRVKKSCGCEPCCRWDDPKEEMSEKTDLGNVVREEIGYRDVTFRPDLKVMDCRDNN